MRISTSDRRFLGGGVGADDDGHRVATGNRHTTRATSFLGSTFGIENNDNIEDDLAKEEMGGGGGVAGGILSATHDAGHFCMTGKRPGWRMRWPSGPNANKTRPHAVLFLHIKPLSNI